MRSKIKAAQNGGGRGSHHQEWPHVWQIASLCELTRVLLLPLRLLTSSHRPQVHKIRHALPMRRSERKENAR